MLTGLRSVFETRKVASSGSFDKDTFQAWLSDAAFDLEIKAQVLTQAYYAAMGVEVSIPHAITMIRSGGLLKL